MTRHDDNKRQQIKWEWVEGAVDPHDEYIEIRYGDYNHLSWSECQPVARLGKPAGHCFHVQWLVNRSLSENEIMTNAAKKELDFYLIELGELDPWGYALYHCGTSANGYSDTHWSYYSKDENKYSNSQQDSFTSPALAKTEASENGKILHFSQAKQEEADYRIDLEDIKYDLSQVSKRIRSYCLSLAMLKVWKKWDDEQSAGAMLQIFDEMFLECGDENVVKLIEIVHDMEDFCGDIVKGSPTDSNPSESDTSPSPEFPMEDSSSTDNLPTEQDEMVAVMFNEETNKFWVMCPVSMVEDSLLSMMPPYERLKFNAAKDWLISKSSNWGYEMDCYYCTYSKINGRVQFEGRDYICLTVNDFEGSYRPIKHIRVRSLNELKDAEVEYDS